MIEAFNRTLADAIGSMVVEEGGDWEESLPWARRAYLSAVHTALSSGSVGLSPAEAYRGWAVKNNLAIDTRDLPTDPDSPTLATVVEVKDRIAKALRWIKESRLDYERQMEGTRRNQHRRNRTFKLGSKVRLF